MNESVQEMSHKKRHWYNNQRFPLIPNIETRDEDEYNTWKFSFDWLFIRIWSRDAFDFEIAFVVSEHWGIGITMLIPYLRLVFCIPIPFISYYWVQDNLWRKPKKRDYPC